MENVQITQVIANAHQRHNRNDKEVADYLTSDKKRSASYTRQIKEFQELKTNPQRKCEIKSIIILMLCLTPLFLYVETLMTRNLPTSTQDALCGVSI